MNAGGNDQIIAIRPYVKHFQLLLAIYFGGGKKNNNSVHVIVMEVCTCHFCQ
jgi:hypothetical protein